jgi:hypothetical protein
VGIAGYKREVNVMAEISLKGLNKAKVLAALFNNA